MANIHRKEVGVTPLLTRQSVLEVTSISKQFGATRALRDCSFTLQAGEVHALVGENGSGKSTLVKILSGIHSPDSGTIELNAKRLKSLVSPRISQESGIATVFQEVLAIESRSVLENVWLGQDSLFRTKVPTSTKRHHASQLLSELLVSPPSLDALVGGLSLSDRQALGVVRALLRKPQVLILDEATSALDYDTRTRLFTIIQRLSADGVGVILITHRMDEVDEIADRVTVLRSGETVGTLERGNWGDQALVHLMTGSAERTIHSRPAAVATDSATDGQPPLVTVRGLRLTPISQPIDLDIHRGELIGLAGLEGHGQDSFIKALWGEPVAGGRVVKSSDRGAKTIDSPAVASGNGIAYVPRERRSESLFEKLSILENFAVPTRSNDAVFGLVRNQRTTDRFEPYKASLKIKLGTNADLISTLSGGNQQKVIIARWLATKPDLLLLNDPTRGIDVNAKRDLYALLAQLVATGLTVVMLSTEVDEHVELMDRVLVFRENELARIISRTQLTREELISSFFGDRTGKADVNAH